MKKVGVIILNYKVKDQVIQCVMSVKRSSYKKLDIIVVDNDSADGLELEMKKVPGVTFIETGVNAGYTGGNNIGIKRALENGNDYIFILNPDTTIESNTMKSLCDFATNKGAGVVGPKVLFSGTNKIWYAGGSFDSLNVIGSHRGVNEEDHGQFDKYIETDYVTGAALFVDSEIFQKVGLFDEKFFLYYEDADFCFRAKQAGFLVMYYPQAVVYHKNAQSAGLGSKLQDYYITRNRMLYASKFLPLRTRFALLREAIRNCTNPTRRKALIDFELGRFGKGDIQR